MDVTNQHAEMDAPIIIIMFPYHFMMSMLKDHLGCIRKVLVGLRF